MGIERATFEATCNATYSATYSDAVGWEVFCCVNRGRFEDDPEIFIEINSVVHDLASRGDLK